jgi:glycosyltransferase involved in cell wall biosynthesis
VTGTRVIAYFGNPHVGGTYTVYRLLREGLSEFGWSVKWVGLGPDAQSRAGTTEWAGERAFGEVVAARTADERIQAMEFLRHLESAGYAAIFVNVLANRVQTNAVRYADGGLPKIMIVHSTSPGTYAAARCIRDHVHGTVGVSQRIRDDLVRHLGFSAEQTHAIANAYDAELFRPLVRQTWLGPLRLLSLGRIDDCSKGVFWLPEILRRLDDLELTLTVAGDGPDRAELQRRFGKDASRVRFIGAVSPDQVPHIMAQHDIFLMPSRFEGLGVALIEALASGCVPVASLLRGVTDFVVETGKGFLFPVGNVAVAANFVRKLGEDRQLLKQIANDGHSSALARFPPRAMAGAYASLLDAVIAKPPAVAQPLNPGDWRFPMGLRSGLRTLLPKPMKNHLRQLRERWV